MKEIKRVCLVVLDSLGVGAEPDADKYGDAGTNTLMHIAEKMFEEKGDFKVKNLSELGYFNVDGLEAWEINKKLRTDAPQATYGRLRERSVGKDTVTGHWEIAGILTPVAFKTYPDGFPKELIEAFEKEIGCETLGNIIASGTDIIRDLGPEHEKTGKPIVYTSTDSVFQIAANTAVIPLERLYEICEIARKLLVGKWACARVIARPYVLNADGSRTRTSDRKDYAVDPPAETMLDLIQASGKETYCIGKIRNIFNNHGVTNWVHTDDNADGIEKTIEALKMDFAGLIFTNLVDFDSEYGHRRNAIGYGEAIEYFDKKLDDIWAAMKDDDLLIVTADHGNDPTHVGFDHTREYIPMLICSRGITGKNLGTKDTFADIGATICDILGAAPTALGKSFKDELEFEK